MVSAFFPSLIHLEPIRTDAVIRSNGRSQCGEGSYTGEWCCASGLCRLVVLTCHMYACVVITYSRVWINRVRLLNLLVVS